MSLPQTGRARSFEFSLDELRRVADAWVLTCARCGMSQLLGTGPKEDHKYLKDTACINGWERDSFGPSCPICNRLVELGIIKGEKHRYGTAQPTDQEGTT